MVPPAAAVGHAPVKKQGRTKHLAIFNFEKGGFVNRPTNLPLGVMGLSMLFLAPGMAICAAVEWGANTPYGEWPLLASALISASLGLIFLLTTQFPANPHPSAVFPAVVSTWFGCSVIGTLPYLLSGAFGWAQWDSALFESISGFTCTGSTLMSDIESHGRGLLMWRQLTQWYGGMGMVVLAVSVLPLLGVGGLELMNAEAPGPDSDRLAPRISGTAKRLWLLYVSFTILIALALFLVPGVGLYDAAAHALSTVSTGGFSPYSSSIGHFDSLAVELIIALGLILCAMSFAMHYRAFTGDFGAYRRAFDQMLFLKIILTATAAATLLLWLRAGNSFGLSLRDGFFNVVTLASSGGFANIRAGGVGDYAHWLPPAQILLAVLMLIGGGVGSTAGGMKVFRFNIVMGHTIRSLRLASRRRALLPVKLGGRIIPERIVGRVLAFATLFLFTCGVGTLILSALGTDPITAASGALSAMSNMGPALGEAGPSSNFLVFSRPARGVLAALMLVGRLEITAVLLGVVVLIRRSFLRSRRRQL